ncbi:peptidyl-prolyl cis-trans isomerase [Candidatus Dependentiae bacterium]|nr:peptidyl-prolyl cis-trans isomerase [Candidatus Dependentiae bacterium]
MKKNLLFILSVFFVSSVSARDLVDCVVARVNDVVICKSDLNEPQLILGGRTRDLERCIMDEILLQKAQQNGVVPSQEDVEKKAIAYRNGHGFGYKSGEEYERFLGRAGLSSKKVVNQIKNSGAAARMEMLLMPKGAVVSRDEIVAFCEKNPEQKEALYLVSFSTGSKDLVDENGHLTKKAATQWSRFDGWLSESELSKSMKFITKMEPGQVSEPVIRGDSFFIYRLEEKQDARLFTIEERYAGIEQRLLEEAKKDKFIDIKKRLRQEACVVYMS